MTVSVTSRWQLFTVEEAASILGIGRSTLYRLIRGRDSRGRHIKPVPHHQIRGVGIRFTGEDLDAILAEAERGRR